jgi:hypothetical protein
MFRLSRKRTSYLATGYQHVTQVSREQSILSALEARYEAKLGESGEDLAFSDFSPEYVPNMFLPTGELNVRAAKTFIRDQEDVRGYTSFEEVGKEEPAIYFARLARVQQVEGPYRGNILPPLQNVLDLQAEPVQKFIQNRLGLHLPYPVLVKLSPTGELNAKVERVPEAGGALVLINAGLMDLIYRVLKISLAASSRGSSPPVLSSQQATKALAEAFNAYLYAGSSHFAWPLPRLPQDQEGELRFLIRRAERFVICHEFGHIILGHVPLQSPLRLTPEFELQADDFSTLVLSQMLRKERHFRKLAGHLGVSIFSFFATAIAIEQLRVAFKMERSAAESHPGLLPRRIRVEQHLDSRLPGRHPLLLAFAFDHWMNTQLQSVILLLKEVNENVRRPGQWDTPD